MSVHASPPGQAHANRRARATENAKINAVGASARRELSPKEFGARNALFQKAKAGNKEAMAAMAKIAPLTAKEQRQIPV